MGALGSFVKTGDFKSEKHVPVIEIPNGIKAGEEFEVKVSVGRDVPHPNTTEHFITYIQLFYKAEGSGVVTDLGKAEFLSHGESTAGPNKGGVYVSPYAVFKVKLSKPGTLYAWSYCNIHGLWEGSADIRF